MKYYKIIFENGVARFDWYTSAVSYLTDDEFLMLSIHEHTLLVGVQAISEVYRQDQINFAGEVKQTKIYPCKELEDLLLLKKQQHWH